MATIFYMYQLTTSIITAYGYWKIFNTGYNQYYRAKVLLDITLRIANKLKFVLDMIPTSKEKHQLEYHISALQLITNELSKHPKILYSNKPFKTNWEILYKEEIENNIKVDKFILTETKTYFPDLSNYIYINDKDNTIETKID